ncbi:ParB N-terminal domain-containing protein [Yersinia enterocolitica]|uniref:ParB/Srx family N-terminal domain-containing protein n=1 Tax=Yersinia enterocolitica TaxID=630 RepID=UPI00155B2198|nr:ParB/Srx family N-terminal domain-containing protein [Yersinia enterocolitica]MBX9485826.1 ParB N-terminal domain-containing protein [Yersinia enterocolitica]NQS96713.1 ParB N-terminal domain-containing protein [Yersinia enterocolitica]NQT43390.1 ParB N-terminal domain-containing protein [Yersinia enterocolitica]NQT98810.1 ParB N-terminal domain-containing protein [Yersinia enterocolitica]HDL8115192.1 ParB N-terminal domain-containing protein [Yersinia enterocolitica]
MLKIEYLSLSTFKRYEKNSRLHSDEQINQLVNSIREFGFTNPVLIDEENEIIAGHGRLTAAESEGMEKIPAIRLKGLSAGQKKALRIADNQLALNASWDEVLLATEVQELDGIDFDCEVLGFSDEQLDALLSGGDSDDGPKSSGDNAPTMGIKYLSIDKERVPATDEEIAALFGLYGQYSDSKGTHVGFVGWLADRK